MKKILFTSFFFCLFSLVILAEEPASYELGVGLRFQKTEQLYWENGVGADFTSDFLLQKKIHLKLSYATSRLGTAFLSNAIRQDNYLIGADWHFMADKPFQIFAGLNTGFFHADMESPQFDVLPNNSLLFSVEAGMSYKFKFPVTVSLSTGYNLISGDGLTVPGSLFPVFYQLSVYYHLK